MRRDLIFVTLGLALFLVVVSVSLSGRVAEETDFGSEYDSKYRNNQELVKELAQAWPTYSDDFLGISFQYPSEVSEGRIVFFRVGSVLFVTPENSAVYQRRSELLHKSDKDVLDAASAISTYGYWAIWVREATDEADIETAIKEKFSSFKEGCKVGGLQSFNTEGVYSVVITDTDPSFEGVGSCFVNYRVAFLYSPENNRVAIWDMGQDMNFYLTTPAEQGYAADDVMLKSFKFLQQSRTKK